MIVGDTTTAQAPGWRAKMRALRAQLGEFLRLAYQSVALILLIVPVIVTATAVRHVFGMPVGSILVLGFTYWLAGALIHELGHAAMARAAGWDVHIICVAHLAYFPARRIFSRRVLGRREQVGGFVLATPPRLEQWRGLGYLGFALGGAAANSLSALLCFGLVQVWPSQSGVWPALIGGFGVFSALMAALNLVPVYGPDRWRSDGAQVLDLLLRRGLSDASLALVRLRGLQHDGVPRRDWDSALVDRIDIASATPDTLRFAAAYYLAVGEAATALDACRRLERLRPGSTAPAILAFLVALIDRDPAQARDILAKGSEVERNAFEGWRALAVILAVEGRHEDARAAVRKARGDNNMGDEDDKTLFAAIDEERELPTRFGAAA